MKKEEIKITLTDEKGEIVFVQAMITRTIAREVESFLERNGAYLGKPEPRRTQRRAMV
jgi:hypothetical protein